MVWKGRTSISAKAELRSKKYELLLSSIKRNAVIRYSVKEPGTFEELHYMKRGGGLKGEDQVQDYTSGVRRGQTMKNLKRSF